MKRVYLKSLPIDLATPAQIIEQITGWLKQPERFYHIVTLNALMAIAAHTNATLTGIIQQADLVTIDGYGIAAALKRQGQTVPPRLPGVVMTQNLLDWCSNHSRRLYLYGGSPETARKLKNVIPTRWPGLSGSFIRDGYTSGDVRRDIIAQQPDLLLVGLGTPAQEIWIASLADQLKHTVAIGVGGSFEIIAGLKREAPLLIRNSGLEWVYRMIQDPRRINRIPRLIEFWYHYLR